uniref:Putative secreted protein n=1 Tax=Ixodes ricinus TaxID=34613 RepID=A0A6B0UWE2_IXORI
MQVSRGISFVLCLRILHARHRGLRRVTGRLGDVFGGGHLQHRRLFLLPRRRRGSPNHKSTRGRRPDRDEGSVRARTTQRVLGEAFCDALHHFQFFRVCEVTGRRIVSQNVCPYVDQRPIDQPLLHIFEHLLGNFPKCPKFIGICCYVLLHHLHL